MRIKSSKRQSSFSVAEKLVLVLLLLSFAGFNDYSIPLILLAFLVLVFIKQRLNIPVGIIPPLLLTIGMFFSLRSLAFSSITLKLVWPAAYLLGYEMMRGSRATTQDFETREKRINVCILIATTGFLIHLLLNLWINYQTGGLGLGRDTIDFWTKSVIVATGQAGLACIPMGWCVAYLFNTKKLISKIGVLAVMVVMLYYNLTLASRTIIYSMLVLFGVSLLFLLVQNKDSGPKSSVVMTLTIVALVIIVVYVGNFWGVRTLVENSILMERLTGGSASDVINDTRWHRKMQFLRLMPQHLTGGSGIRRAVGGYAHDILLDTYDAYGPLAFVAVIAILWDSIAKALRLLKLPTVSSDTKRTVLCIYVSCLIVFTVEPVLQGLPWLLMSYCFIHGMITGYITKKESTRKIEQNENA